MDFSDKKSAGLVAHVRVQPRFEENELYVPVAKMVTVCQSRKDSLL